MRNLEYVKVLLYELSYGKKVFVLFLTLFLVFLLIWNLLLVVICIFRISSLCFFFTFWIFSLTSKLVFSSKSCVFAFGSSPIFVHCNTLFEMLYQTMLEKKKGNKWNQKWKIKTSSRSCSKTAFSCGHSPSCLIKGSVTQIKK